MRDSLNHRACERERERERESRSEDSERRTESERIASENWVIVLNSLHFKLEKEFENVNFKRNWNAERGMRGISDRNQSWILALKLVMRTKKNEMNRRRCWDYRLRALNRETNQGPKKGLLKRLKKRKL